MKVDLFSHRDELQVQTPKEERRDQEKLYHKMALSEVQADLGDWVKIFMYIDLTLILPEVSLSLSKHIVKRTCCRKYDGENIK